MKAKHDRFRLHAIRRAGRHMCRLSFAIVTLLVLLSLGRPATTHAQTPRPRFERLSIEDGLSQSKINCIFQDQQGFMWFGTVEGLNKYDGYTFAVYTFDPDDPTSISDNVVHAIYEDHTGVLWIGTRNGLNRFDRDTQAFTRFLDDPDDPSSISDHFVTSILEDATGTLWFGTNSGGVSRFDRATQTFTNYKALPDSPTGTLVSVMGSTLYADRAGDLWAGNSAGLYRFDREQQRFVQIVVDPADPGRGIYTMQEDRPGMFWLGTDNGLYQFDRATQTAISYQHDPGDPRSLSDNRIHAILEDRAGTLWIGTQNAGLNVFDRETKTFAHYLNDPSDLHSLSGNTISALYEDRAGLLWIGTGGGGNGLNMFNPATYAFHHYTYDASQPQTFSTRTVATVYEDRAGIIWLGGYDEDGLNRFDRATRTITTYAHAPGDPASLPHDSIYEIYEDRGGTLWIGTLGGGIAAFDRARQTFTNYRHDPGDPTSLSNDIVPAIYEDHTGTLWIGTEDGLNAFDREAGTFRAYVHNPADPQSLSHSEISSIYEDRDGILWIGTWGGGLNRFDRTSGTFQRYLRDPENSNSISDNRIFSLTGDQQGTLWIGTKIGLNKFSPATNTFTHYTTKDGLPTDGAACVLIDHAGLVWVSTGKGLAKLDPATGAIRRFSARAGLQSDDFNGGACSRSAQGELFFGGNNGFNAFDPQQIAAHPYGPPVVLTNISKLNRPIDLQQDLAALTELALSYDDKVIAFEFAALDYADPRNNQYAYTLEGFDETWIQAGTQRSATYTNLDGGDYIFRVKAANSDGVWSNAEVAVHLHVATPPWQTWWAYGLYLLLALSIVGAGARSYARERAHRALQSEIAERKRAEQEQQRLYQVAEGLRETVAVINSTRSLADVLEFIIIQAIRLLNVEAGQICRLQWDEKAQEDVLCIEATQGFSSSHAGVILKNAPLTISHQAIRSRRPVAASDITPEVEWLPAQPAFGTGQHTLLAEIRQHFSAMLAVPLLIKDEVYGTITLYDRAKRTFTEEEINLAIAFARQSALALENAQMRQQIKQAAVREERGRLARELHDSVTQSIYSLTLLAEGWRLAARDTGGLAQVEQQFARIGGIAHQALKEMRLLIHHLRLPELEREGLVGALERRLDSVERRSGLDARVLVEGALDLPTAVEEQVYWIIQEALNNALKHSAATAVVIAIRGAGDLAAPDYPGVAIEIQVRDNGCGFDPVAIAPGFGMGSMRERAECLGGSLAIHSAPGTGTTVSVRGTIRRNAA